MISKQILYESEINCFGFICSFSLCKQSIERSYVHLSLYLESFYEIFGKKFNFEDKIEFVDAAIFGELHEKESVKLIHNILIQLIVESPLQLISKFTLDGLEILNNLIILDILS